MIIKIKNKLKSRVGAGFPPSQFNKVLSESGKQNETAFCFTPLFLPA
jgi:hypothetical protein